VTHPLKAEKRAPKPPMPKCENCGHSGGDHAHKCYAGPVDPTENCIRCDGGVPCRGYRPKRIVRARAPKPIGRSSKPARSKRPRRQRKSGRAALGRLADKLCGQIVRARGACEGDIHGKGGALQWAHGFSRRYHAVRWLPINGFCLCQGCHLYYSLRPLEWDGFIRYAWGTPTYEELRIMALRNDRVDLEATVSKLRAELASHERSA
jgi:hypothetical protein